MTIGWSPTITWRVIPRLALLGPIWPGLIQFGLNCPCLAPFGSVWSCLALSAPFGPVWSYLAPFCLVWPCLDYLTPSGFFCSCLAQFGTLLTRFNTIQSSLTPFYPSLLLFTTFPPYLNLFNLVWPCCTLFGKCLALFGPATFKPHLIL